jgi:hypothetical protein
LLEKFLAEASINNENFWHRYTTTYSELAEKLGYAFNGENDGKMMGWLGDLICLLDVNETNGLLTCVLLAKSNGMPGPGFYKTYKIAKTSMEITIETLKKKDRVSTNYSLPKEVEIVKELRMAIFEKLTPKPQNKSNS